jgi:hypothetical protein
MAKAVPQTIMGVVTDICYVCHQDWPCDAFIAEERARKAEAENARLREREHDDKVAHEAVEKYKASAEAQDVIRAAILSANKTEETK